MTSPSFTLQPFHGPGGPEPDILPAIRIDVHISRASRLLTIGYEVAGDTTAVDLPPLFGQPERRAFLWKETCFELFFRTADSNGYWEVNLSPAGHWNLYRFEGYREGMREEEKAAAPLIHVDAGTPGIFRLSAELRLKGFMEADQPLHAGVSAVIKTRSGQVSYWALNHPGPQPDFHHPDGFAVHLE